MYHLADSSIPRLLDTKSHHSPKGQESRHGGLYIAFLELIPEVALPSMSVMSDPRATGLIVHN